MPVDGELFILSAPSGTGKTSIIRRMLEGPMRGHEGFSLSVSHTTRRPRQGELDGGDYHFIERPVFEEMIERDLFLEWAVYNGNLYGTSRQEVEPRLASGVDVLIEVEVQGAEQVMERHPEAHSIFVLPPTYDDLERRIRGRGLDEGRDIAGRLAVSLWEIKRYDRYDYVIINDDLETASRSLAAVILEKRHRRPRVDPRVQAVLESFERAAGRE